MLHDDGFMVKTGDTILEVVAYAYDGRVRMGDRLQDHE